MQKSIVLLLCLIPAISYAVEHLKTIDSGGSGPYKAIALTELSLKNYVVYRPQDIKHTAQTENTLPVVFTGLLDGGHSGTFEEPYGGSFAILAIKWLDWHLKRKKQCWDLFEKQVKPIP